MSNNAKSRKPLIVGIIAAVVILIVLLVLMLTQCTGMFGGGNTNPNQESTVDTTPAEVASYDLYWNLDRALYDGMSEAGLSSRQPAEDGYFHVRFFKDGEIIELKVADRKTINAMEVKDLMGLEFDENGIVTGIIDIEDMPLEKVAWQFYVQSTGGKIIKANSSETMNGMEVMLETGDKTVGVWDMTGMSGDPGCDAEATYLDRIYAIQNEAGELTHVYIYYRGNYMTTHEADCEHCGKVVTWYEWNKENALPITAGHYQLQNDITLTGQMSMNEDAKICLDLNGKRVDGKSGARVYSLHNPGTELAIMDTSEGKTGTLAAHGTGDQGMVVWLRYGACYLYDGILDASDAATRLSGTAVTVPKSSFFYMYGGEIIGGTSKYVKNETTGKYSQGLGGTIMLTGKMVMNDGVIRDGYAQAVTYYKDGNKVWERGIGGNIFMSSGAVFEMNGGEIKNGKAGNLAGNIYMDGASEFTMNGGKIQGGTISGKGKNGGSIYVTTKAKFTQNGGSITGGTSRNCGGNVYLNGTYIMNGGVISGGKIRNYETGKLNPTANSRNLFNVNGDFYMYGGRIYGGVQAIDSKADDKDRPVVLLSGYATIKGTVEGGNDLVLTAQCDGVKVKVGNMLSGSSVGVHASTGIFSEKTKQGNVDNFYSNVEGAEVIYYDGCLALGKLACLCGANEGEEHIGECDETEILWAPWTSTSSLPTTTGNYYLTKDVSAGQNNIAADAQIVLDLNGHRVEGRANSRIYSLHNRTEIVTKDEETGEEKKTYEYNSTLTITDSSEGHVGVMAAHGQYDTQGAIVWLRYGNFNLYRGTLDASDFIGMSAWSVGSDGIWGTSDDGTTTKPGVAVNIPANRVFNMYGGTIIGGTTAANALTKTNSVTQADGTVVETTASKTITAPGGGSVSVEGTFHMYGGEIRDGRARQGGNVFVSSSGKFYLHDGKILNGSTFDIGGNTYANGWIYMEGGEISGGYYQKDENSTPNYNAKTANMTFIGGKLQMSGGVIDGRVQFNNYNSTSNCKVILSGSPVINGADNGGIGLSLTALDDKPNDNITAIRPDITVEGELSADAKIVMNSDTVGYITFETAEANADNFFSDITDSEGNLSMAAYRNGKVFIGKVNCLCGFHTGKHIDGCDGTEYEWTYWTSTTALPNTTGNYILTNNIGLTTSLNPADDSVIRIDLNGKTVSRGNGSRMVTFYQRKNANLTITDTTEKAEGKLVSTGKSTNQGNMFWMTSGAHTLNFHRGTLDASGFTLQSTATGERSGAIIEINSASTVNVYGGTMIGGTTIADATGAKTGNGGAIACTGTLNIYGGTIKNGKSANNGGNLIIWGTLNMTGGQVIDGQANTGGNIAVQGGKVITSDCTISGGTATKGGNMYFFHNGFSELDLGEGTVISGGKATDNTSGTAALGGNVFLNASNQTSAITGYINGATIKDGESERYGGNVYVYQKVNLIMNSGTISGGKAALEGGNVLVNTGSTFELVNGTVSDGEAATSGGNFYMNGTVTITGGTVSGGKATGNPDATGDSGIGGNFSIYGTLNINGGMISGGTATAGAAGGGHGGNIYVTKVLNITGGTITGGNAYNGGNIGTNNRNAEIKISGGIIENGVAGNRGGNIGIVVRPCKTLELNGGTIRNGKAASGGNLGLDFWVSGGLTQNVVIDGATITGGESTSNGGGNIYLKNNPETTTNVLTVTMKSGTVSDGKTASNGANVYANARTTFNLEGGTVSGGTSPSGYNGGSIYIASGASMGMSGGTVTGGAAGNTGGNIYANGTVTVSGGKITGGASYGTNKTAATANIYIVNGTLNVSGGQIDGYVGVNSWSANASVILSGKPVITGGTTNLKLDCGSGYALPTVTINGTLESGSNVGISRADGTFTNITAESNAQYLHADNENQDVYYVSDAEGLYIGKYGCVCGETDGSCIGDCDGTPVKWTALTADTQLGTPGYYYLTGDMNSSATIYMNTAGVYALDLNGYKYSSSASRVFSMFTEVDSDLIITDSSTENDGMLVTTHKSTENGGIVWVRYSTSSMKIYGGTLTTEGGMAKKNGHIIETAGQVDMYAGTISGGTSYRYKDADGKFWGAMGGNIAIGSAGVFNLHGGEVTGGKTVNDGTVLNADGSKNTTSQGGNFYVDGELNIKGGTVSGGTATIGGNIYVSANGELNLTSGSVTGGVTTGNGGSIFIAGNSGVGGVFNMTGGSVSGGKTGDGGGNIYLNGKVTISGGSVSGGMDKNGTTTGVSANIFVVNGILELKGSYVPGQITLTKSGTGTCELRLSGDVDLSTGGYVRIGTYNTTVLPTIYLDGALAEGSKIKVSTDAANVSKVFAKNSSKVTLTADHKAFFESAEGYQVALLADGLYMVPADAVVRCVCGGKAEGVGNHECVDVVWTEWTATDSLPADAGNYILTANVDLKGARKLPANGTYSIDLNGKTITQLNGDRVFTTLNQKNCVFNITDTAGNGKIVAANSLRSDQGGLIWLQGNGNHVVNIYAGTLDASKYTVTNVRTAGNDGVLGTSDDSSSERNGAGISVDATGVLNMYGGEIIGGYAAHKEISGYTATWSAHGGSVAVGGTFNMYGGTIKGGKSDGDGGNVMVYGKFVMTGGTIEGGRAVNGGGNIRISSNASVNSEISGGTVKDGAASKGGNIAIWSGKQLKISGTAQILNGGCGTGGGGNIHNSGTLIMTGGTVNTGYQYTSMTDFVVTGKNTGFTQANMYSGGTLSMSGGRVYGTTTLGGSATTTISGTAVIYHSATGNNLNVGGTVNFGKLETGAKIGFFLAKSTSATKVYGNLTVTMTDAEIAEYFEAIAWDEKTVARKVVQRDGKLYVEIA